MLIGTPLDGPYCTLTVLSPRVAVTAAHCVHIWPDDTLDTEGQLWVRGSTQIGVGLGDAMSGPATEVRRVWIHPGYDTLASSFDFRHDLALLFLSDPVKLDAYPTIAPLPAGETPRSVGYGGTASGGPGSKRARLGSGRAPHSRFSPGLSSGIAGPGSTAAFAGATAEGRC